MKLTFLTVTQRAAANLIDTFVARRRRRFDYASSSRRGLDQIFSQPKHADLQGWPT